MHETFTQLKRSQQTACRRQWPSNTIPVVIGVGLRLVVVNFDKYCRTWSNSFILDIAHVKNFGLWGPDPLGLGWMDNMYSLRGNGFCVATRYVCWGSGVPALWLGWRVDP